jgi:bacterioferritin-associated ferredoxin
MYVCVCLAVTEAEVEAAIAGGAVTREAVTRACRAGGDCGACHGMIESKIEDHLETAVSGIISCPAVSSSGPQPLAPVHADLVSADSLVRARNRAA